MSELTICRLADRPEFLDELAVHLHSSFGHLRADSTVARRKERLREHMGAAEIPNTFIATRGSTLLGSASLVKFAIAERHDISPWLASVFTAPEYRRLGVATALIHHVESFAARMPTDTLYLFTEDQQGLYGRMGWVAIGAHTLAGTGVTIMKKSI